MREYGPCALGRLKGSLNSLTLGRPSLALQFAMVSALGVLACAAVAVARAATGPGGGVIQPRKLENLTVYRVTPVNLTGIADRNSGVRERVPAVTPMGTLTVIGWHRLSPTPHPMHPPSSDASVHPSLPTAS